MAIIGIDLGTTNSLAAYWNAGKATLIPNALGDFITPSVVGLDERGDILIGKAAKERLQTAPDKTTAYFKRNMGTNKQVKLGRKQYRPEELSALVLKSLKEDAEHHLGEPVTEAVISVPAYFSDAQRKATKTAGTLAGLTVERLINEPTAAAIAYGLHNTNEEQTFLVFDLGGGTFDVSVLEIFDGVMQVHASAGDNFLGGEDFAESLAAYFVQQHDIALKKLNSGELGSLHAAAERCKRELSQNTTANMKFQYKNHEYTSQIDRQTFENLVSPLVQRLQQPVERALKDSGLHASDLNAIVLVGGASRMPIVRSLTAKMLGQLPHTHINPDEVIALGTAVQVGLKTQDISLKEVVLTDVAPYTLGTGIVNMNSQNPNDLLFHPIIERNSPVPISRVDTLCTVNDFQTQITVDIYQGESRLAKNNIKLGEISAAVPRDKAGQQTIDVRFTYDINGLLEVEVQVNQTGHKQRLVIEGNPGLMSLNEIEKRLAELANLKIHPRDQIENTHLLARSERLYIERLGETRRYIQELISQFESILNTQDQAQIESAREQISKILDSLESDHVF